MSDSDNHITSCPLLDKISYDKLVKDSAKEATIMIKNEVFQEVGRSVVQKAFYTIGAVTVAAILWLNSKHYF